MGRRKDGKAILAVSVRTKLKGRSGRGGNARREDE